VFNTYTAGDWLAGSNRPIERLNTSPIAMRINTKSPFVAIGGATDLMGKQ
jgi:hypothetical protein